MNRPPIYPRLLYPVLLLVTLLLVGCEAHTLGDGREIDLLPTVTPTPDRGPLPAGLLPTPTHAGLVLANL